MYSEVLRIPAFRNLWLGQAISQFGDAFYYVAFMFMVKQVTKSDAMVGYVGALETLPYLLFGPYSGVIADRIDRRVIMLASDLLSAVALGLFAAVLLYHGEPPVWLLMGTAFALSSVRVFFMPAKSAAIPNVLPADMVMRGNGLSMTTQTMMPLLGLALSGGVMGAVFEWNPGAFYTTVVVVNAASFLLSALFIAMLPALRPERKEGESVRAMADFREGLVYIRRRHDLSVLVALLTVFRFSVAPFFVVYIATNEQWFDGKPATLAWLEFSFFLGMVITSLFVGRLRVNRPALWMSWAFFTVGATVAAMAFSYWVALYILFNFVAGLAVPLGDVPITTYMQLSVTDAYRGRVNSVLNMMANGCMPISMVAAGWFLGRFGVSATYLAMGGGMMAACAYGLLDRKFRSVEMPATGDAPSREDPPLVGIA